MTETLFDATCSDTLQVWDDVLDSMKSSTVTAEIRDIKDLDCSFITPTILSLGQFTEVKIEDLCKLIGSPVVIWNLSGKHLSSDNVAKLNGQTVDVPWVTPNSCTQVPSLECILAQCFSIKSWLDISSDHVVIVHCSNGRSRSGILIACLLKYIGAFDFSYQAFEFFCSARYMLI